MSPEVCLTTSEVAAVLAERDKLKTDRHRLLVALSETVGWIEEQAGVIPALCRPTQRQTQQTKMMGRARWLRLFMKDWGPAQQTSEKAGAT